MWALDGCYPGCYLGAPLVRDGRSFGVLELYGSVARLHPWSDEDQALFGIVSMLVGASLTIDA